MIALMLRSAAISAALALGLAFGSAQAADKPQPYHADVPHTQILFAISHMGFSTTRGTFGKYDVDLKFDPKKPAKTKVDVTIDTASITTGFGPRDEHLKTPDFFNVAEFPTMTFKSTSTKVTGPDTAELTGNLTLLGVTKPVTLDVKLTDSGPSPFMPNVNVYGFSASGTIKRSDFGMSKFLPPSGGRGVGDDVAITISSEVNNAAPPPPPKAN